MHTVREKGEAKRRKGERDTRGRRSLIYRFCCRPPSTFHMQRAILLRHVAFQFSVPPAHNESVCKSTNRDHNSFVRYRVLTRGQSSVLRGTRHGATRDDARPGEEDKDTEDRPRQLQAHACIRARRYSIQRRGEKIPVKLT